MSARTNSLRGKKSKGFRSDDAKLASTSKKAKLEAERATVVSVPAQVTSYRLHREFFNEDCDKLTQALLGKLLVKIDSDRTRLSGVIVEAEAYLGVTDPCCHAYRGKVTDRNAAMFKQPGTSYVYISYGMYFCANIVSAGNGAAVLIRALEPREGISTMQRRREAARLSKQQRKLDTNTNSKRAAPNSSKASEFTVIAEASTSRFKVTELCNGPAKLCESLGITRDGHNMMDMCTSDTYFVESTAFSEFEIVKTTRIGLNAPGSDWPLRYYVKGNKCVSKT